MKRKIIALVLALVMIPSILLAASNEYTKTESVTYNPITVTYNGQKVNEVIQINDELYVSLNDFWIFGNKIKSTNTKTGDLYISNQIHIGFMFNNWGDSKEYVKKIMLRTPDSEDNTELIYNNVFNYEQRWTASYQFKDNKLYSGHLTCSLTQNDCIRMYEDIIRKLYDEFDTIVFKDAYLPESYPQNSDLTDIIKNNGAYLYAKFKNDTDQAYIDLKYDLSSNKFVLQIEFTPNE